MALTTKEAQNLLNKKTKNIVFNEEYKSDKVKHQFKCTECNHHWETTPNILKRKGNIGCPKCNEKKVILKKEKKEFSSIRGATKLLKNSTLPMSSVSNNHKISELRKITSDINSKKQPIKDKKLDLSEYKNLHRIHLKNLKEQASKQNHFGWFFAIILFPIWIWYQMKFSEEIAPYKELEANSSKILNNAENELYRLNRDLESLENSLRILEEDIEYEKNIARLSNRINIQLGGKTNLYYFRFRHDGKKYYKIGITVNSVHYRYRNGDGSSYRAIEKIFFDTTIYDTNRIERLILHTFKDKLANDRSILSKKGGYSEVFVSDVLGLDNY